MNNNTAEKRIEKGIAWLRKATGMGFRFIKWDGSDEVREFPISQSHDKDGSYYGGNCIWLSSAYLHYGMEMNDVRCASNGLLGGNSSYMWILLAPYALAQRLVDSRLGKNRFRLIRKRSRGKLTVADLESGDIIFYYMKGVLFYHTAVYTGDGMIIDCAKEPGGVTERSWDVSYPCRAAIRYTEHK